MRLERLIDPERLFPSRESSVRRSSDEKAGETEPWIRMFDKFIEVTRVLEHLIPAHEQMEVEEFQVFKGKGMESKACLRVIKASKSVEAEDGIERKSVVIIMTKKDIFIFGVFCFFVLFLRVINKFGMICRRNKRIYGMELNCVSWKGMEKVNGI